MSLRGGWAAAALVGLGACGGGSSTNSSPVVAIAAPVAPTAVSTPPAYSAPANTANFTATSLPIWRSARAEIVANHARGGIACVGDSTTAGLGSGGTLVGYARTSAYPTALATYLTEAKIPAHASSFFGDEGLFANFYSSDARIHEINATRHDWVSAPNVPTVGGYVFVNITSTSTIVFTPDDIFDTVDVYDTAPPTGAPFTVDADGARTITIAPATDPAQPVRKSTGTFVLGKHSINIAATEAGPDLSGVQLVGVDAYDSTVKDAAIWNLGWAGSQTSDWVATGKSTSPLTVLAKLSPKLTLIDLGINDLSQQITSDIYRTNMTTIVAAALKNGDVILIIPNRISPALATDAAQDAYATVITALALQFGIPVFDASKALGSFQSASAAGYMFDDAHPSAMGYARIAQGLTAMLMAN